MTTRRRKLSIAVAVVVTVTVACRGRWTGDGRGEDLPSVAVAVAVAENAVEWRVKSRRAAISNGVMGSGDYNYNYTFTQLQWGTVQYSSAGVRDLRLAIAIAAVWCAAMWCSSVLYAPNAERRGQTAETVKAAVEFSV